MPVDMNAYFSSLVRQIGFEKTSFDVSRNLALTLSLGVAGLTVVFSPTTCSDWLDEASLILCGLASWVVLALFFRAVRAYHNYYVYMLLKNTLVKKDVLSQLNNLTDEDIISLVNAVDLRRSLEGDRIKTFSNWKLCGHVLVRTEFLFILLGLLGLETFVFIRSGWVFSALSGYIIIFQLFGMFVVYCGLGPKRKTCTSASL